MFKKEAEEYATRECCRTCNNINHFCKEKCECWTFAKKGAEFGYNKGNKQLTKAKEILRKFLGAKSIEERCVAESEAEQLLKESE